MKRSKQNIQLTLPSLRTMRETYISRLDAARDWSSAMLPTGVNKPLADAPPHSVLPVLVMIGLVLAGLLFGWRLFYLQVAAHERFSELANGNRVRETISYAPRGRVYDRNGKLLAENTMMFQLSVTPYLLPRDAAERQAVYGRAARLVGRPDTEIRTAAEAQGIDSPLPRVVVRNISHETALKVMQFEHRLAGFALSEVPIRQYVADAGLAHILGYTGNVSPEELEADQAAGGDLLPIDIVGKTGIEAAHDDVLRGQPGFERTEVDTLGRPIRVLAKRPARTGQDITLTIDLDVQRRMARDLAMQMKKASVTRASAVMIDPENGEVIAMVSLPYYDNNLFSRGISEGDFARLTRDPDQPLVNKAIAGGYTTGSTIKPLVAAAALEERVVTPQTIIVDSGAIAVTSVYDPGQSFVFRGWRPGGLGPMDVRRAIAWSSNIYFYTVGGGHGGIAGLGVDRLTRHYRAFGLGEPTGIDLPGEIAGRVPDRAWKLANKNEDWFVGDNYNISIGQGDLQVSPLQLTIATAAIANDGYVVKPQLLLKIGDQTVAGRDVKRELKISKQNLKIVREGMRQVMIGGTTCDCVFAKVPVKVAGKTGTAQTTSDESRRPHAWFTAFAPFESRPRLTAAAMLEEGSGGSQFAAPVLAGGMEVFFKGRQ